MAEEDTSFADGFTSVNNDGAPPVDAPKVEEELDPTLLEEVAKDEETQSLLPGYTAEQIQGLFAKTAQIEAINSKFDKLSGHIGNLMQKFEALKAPPPKEDELPDVDADEFSGAYPEFAGFTKQEIDRKLAVLKVYEERLAKMEQAAYQNAIATEETRMEARHPDWVETVSSDGYKVWLGTQPAEYQQQAMETSSATELGKVLTAYKDFAKKGQTTARNKERLEGALVPSGITPARPPEPTEDDGFRSGWAKVAGRR